MAARGRGIHPMPLNPLNAHIVVVASRDDPKASRDRRRRILHSLGQSIGRCRRRHPVASQTRPMAPSGNGFRRPRLRGRFLFPQPGMFYPLWSATAAAGSWRTGLLCPAPGPVHTLTRGTYGGKCGTTEPFRAHTQRVDTPSPKARFTETSTSPRRATESLPGSSDT